MSDTRTTTEARDLLLNTDYGKSAKELIEFVCQLRALGAHIDLELPRIVVIGNQSAGKSSLVEAISGIRFLLLAPETFLVSVGVPQSFLMSAGIGGDTTGSENGHLSLDLSISYFGLRCAIASSLAQASISVPRDAGTCTRCPMECRLSHSTGHWSCQVKIRWEYTEDDERCEEVVEEDFGPLITDKTQVEPILRRAQQAVLHPEEDTDAFLKENYKRKHKNKPLLFSRNVVCVELSGPDLVDLSFVDLPGIVQNAEPKVIELVEDLVNSYIKGSSLILVTLPMSDDIENQKAARLARLVDPKGLRTIGVMTKPDTLTAGATKTRELWLDVLEGRRYPLLHGYYCTRQPDDDERSRGVSSAAAREAEAEFFKKTAPWATSQHQHRLGTTNLVQNISKLLTQIIRESLPGLLAQGAEQLEACKAQLERLPPQITTEPSAFVLALVTDFAAELRARIQGAPAKGCTELVQSTRRIYEVFKDAIRATAPPFVPYRNATWAPRDVSEYIRVDARDKARARLAASGQEGVEGVLYLDDVRGHIRESVTRELPGNVPYAAKVSLIKAFQQGWQDIALGCFEDVQKAFKTALTDLVCEHFERYGNLKGIVGPVVMDLANSCAEATVAQIHTVLALETSPFTQNNHYLSECRDKWLAKYKDARANKGVAERVTPAVPAFRFDFTASSQALGRKDGISGAPADKHRSGGPRKDKPPKPASTAPRKQAKPATSIETSSSSEETASSEETDGEEHRTGKKKPRPAPQTGANVAGAKGPAKQPAVQFPSSLSLFGPRPSTAAQPSSAAEVQVLPPDEERAKAELVKVALGALAELGYAGLSEDDLGKLNKADEYEEELQLMAEVRAYFQVAYKRVIDYVPLTIDHSFLYAFSGKLHERLFERLGLGAANAPARCSAYVAEDPSVVAVRDELLAKKRRLESVQRALYNFGM